MKKEEAIALIMSKYPNHDIEKVTETNKYFLVSIFPKIENASARIRPVLINDGLKAVDKETKEIFTYNPILHDE